MRIVTAAAVALSLCAPHSASEAVRASDTQAASNLSPAKVCNSLTGPFCLHLGLDVAFARHMTPIPAPGDGPTSSAAEKYLEEQPQVKKKCFFRHFARSWMDAGGDMNDLMSQQVKTSDECERLCCEHPKCKSYTFWMGHTCFLRAKRNRPREEGNSFSANKLQ